MLSKITSKSIRWISLAGILSLGLGLVAVTPNPTPAQASTGECTACHKWIVDDWEVSAHGQAATNDTFLAAWDADGNPPECMACHATGYDPDSETWETPGVTCQACHSPYTENHPEEVMPTDMSSRLCGTCHLDTFTQWQESAHSTRNLSCNKCHNAHATSLKTESSQELCQACHNDQVHSFEQTVHAANELMCTDCHVQVSNVALGEGHGRRVHTFDVDLKTCTDCHGDGDRAPNADVAAYFHNLEEQNACPPLAQHGLQSEPEAASPIGYIVIASLFGLGMVAGPLLERWSRRNKNKQED
jgi:hypothetical protein